MFSQDKSAEEIAKKMKLDTKLFIEEENLDNTQKLIKV